MEKIRPGITGTSKKVLPSLSAQESCHVEVVYILYCWFVRYCWRHLWIPIYKYFVLKRLDQGHLHPKLE
jgi:hypothetical protein